MRWLGALRDEDCAARKHGKHGAGATSVLPCQYCLAMLAMNPVKTTAVNLHCGFGGLGACPKENKGAPKDLPFGGLISSPLLKDPA